MTSKPNEAEDLLALAARCEATTGADRDLDLAIALAQPDRFFNAGPAWEGARDRIGEIVGTDRCVPGGGSAPDWLVPRYTASLDAAMTLVPEGGEGFSTSWSPLMEEPNCAAYVWWRRGCTYNAKALSLPLALCAASLRARAAR